MTSVTVVGVCAMVEPGRAVQRPGVVADAEAGTSSGPACAAPDGQPDELGASVLRFGAGRVAATRGNLPGPSRRIVVEPIEVPAQPDQVPTKAPAEPARPPEGQPVPA